MITPVGARVLHKYLKVLRLSFMEFSSIPDLEDLKLVRTVENTIESNTSIFIESPIHVKVQPIDVNDIKAHNKLTMFLYSKRKSTSDFQVKHSSKRLELLNKNISSDRSDVCVVQVPYQLTVNVTTTDNASVEMGKLEGEDFNIKTDNGNVEVSSLKAKNIKIETITGGIITEGKLQATNIDLKTGYDAPICCHSIMASNFFVTTHAGNISVNSCYAENSHFTTAMGNMKLDSLHMSATIDVIQHGNLHITGFAGSLKATLKSGDVFMHASQLLEKNSIFIHEKGKVEMIVSNIYKNLPATNLIADRIKVDKTILKAGRLMDDSYPQRFRYEGEPQNELHIVCKNGSINLQNTHTAFFCRL